MKLYKNFVEYFGKCSSIIADDNYISDGVIVLNKKFTNNRLLKNVKTYDGNILELAKVPFEKGQAIDLNLIGTDCKLLSNSKVGIMLDNNNYVDYSLIDLFEKNFFFTCYTMLPFKNGFIVKIFNENDEFVGLIAGGIINNEAQL